MAAISMMLDYRISLPILVLLYVIYQIIKYPLARLRTVVLNKQRNCAAPPKFRAADPFLGLDVVSRLKTALSERRFLQLLPQLFEEAGSWTFELNQAGNGVVWTADPENIKTILTTSAKDWQPGRSRKEALNPVFGPNIITTEGDYWHETRRVLRLAFTRKQFGELELIRRHVDTFMGRLPLDGTKIDLKPLFYMLSMDISTEFLFGISSNNLTAADNGEAAAFAHAFDVLQNSVVRGQWAGTFGFIYNFFFPDKETQAASTLVTKTLEQYIAKATANIENVEKKDDDSRYNVLEAMLQAWNTQPARVRSESLILLLGGRDTTASALSNLFYYLARRPDVWAKIRAECLAAPQQPTFEELKGLRYLHDCVRESLRLINPTVDLTRTAAVDTLLPRGGGKDGKAPVFVPKGADYDLWIYAVHHRRDIWGDDVEEFRPERWEDYRMTTWAYSPFGGGARVCIGQQLALTEMLYLVYRIAKQFASVESLDSRPWTETLGIGTTSMHGNEVRLQCAKSSK